MTRCGCSNATGWSGRPEPWRDRPRAARGRRARGLCAARVARHVRAAQADARLRVAGARPAGARADAPRPRAERATGDRRRSRATRRRSSPPRVCRGWPASSTASPGRCACSWERWASTCSGAPAHRRRGAGAPRGDRRPRRPQAAARLWREKFERWISGLVGRLGEDFDDELWVALTRGAGGGGFAARVNAANRRGSVDVTIGPVGSPREYALVCARVNMPGRARLPPAPAVLCGGHGHPHRVLRLRVHPAVAARAVHLASRPCTVSSPTSTARCCIWTSAARACSPAARRSSSCGSTYRVDLMLLAGGVAFAIAFGVLVACGARRVTAPAVLAHWRARGGALLRAGLRGRIRAAAAVLACVRRVHLPYFSIPTATRRRWRTRGTSCAR